jgi:hypothetical protein
MLAERALPNQILTSILHMINALCRYIQTTADSPHTLLQTLSAQKHLPKSNIDKMKKNINLPKGRIKEMISILGSLQLGPILITILHNLLGVNNKKNVDRKVYKSKEIKIDERKCTTGAGSGVHIFTYVYRYRNIYRYLHIYLHIYIYICIYIYTYTYTYIYLYTYIYTHIGRGRGRFVNRIGVWPHGTYYGDIE